MGKIQSTVKHCLQKLELFLYKKSIVAEYGNVKIVDLKEKSPWFGVIIHRSLQILEQCDLRRYCRVQKELDRIVNATLAFEGALFRSTNKTCIIDFEEPIQVYKEDGYDFDPLATYYACFIIHEATHGRINRLKKRNLDTDTDTDTSVVRRK